MSDYEKIVEALELADEYAKSSGVSARDIMRQAFNKALPLARELVEYKEGLEWIIGHWTADMSLIVKCSQDAPAIIKQMIGEKT